MNHDESGAVPAVVADHVRAPFRGRHVKWALRTWSLACGIWMVVAFATSDSGLSVLWAVAISLLALGLLLFLTSGRRLFLAPSFLGLIFATGYPLSFAELVDRWAGLPAVGWGSVGRFDFTNEAMVRPFQTIAAGVIGIAVGARLSESIWSGLRSRIVVRRSVSPSFSSILIWALVCIAVISICAKLEIGRVGLQNPLRLPFRLNGVLVIARQFFLPILGALLVHRALDAQRQERLVLTLFVVAGVATVAALGALSRSLAAYYIVPLMLFAVLYQDALGRPLQRLGLLAAVMVVALALVGFFISAQRKTAYFGDEQLSASEVLAETEKGAGFAAGVVESFGGLIGARLGGVDGLLAVAAGPGREPDPWIPVKLFMGDESIGTEITLETFGFIPDTSGSLAFGISLSLWGLLGLGGAILIPFLGSAVLVVLVCSIEGWLAWYGAEAMGATLASLLLLNAWGSPSLFDFVRIAVVVLVALVIARWGSRTLGHVLVRRLPSDRDLSRPRLMLQDNPRFR